MTLWSDITNQANDGTDITLIDDIPMSGIDVKQYFKDNPTATFLDLEEEQIKVESWIKRSNGINVIEFDTRIRQIKQINQHSEDLAL